MQNSPEAPPTGAPPAAANQPLLVFGVIAVAAVALGVLFQDGFADMLHRWQAPEYNHAYMIPFVALYLLWLRGRELQSLRLTGSWFGVILLVISLALMVLGERSAVLTIVQYAFLLALWALVIAASGSRGLRLLWVPLLYLAFMVPLPGFIENRMTASLQLISSEIGVAVIRAAGLTVYLEGNVIDLGNYQLQVAEACSGMRYLFPLVSFGYLCAVLVRGRWWQRGLLLIATVPITILMNSFRIGVIGILVNFYGIEQAEGFLHDFEGWVVFMASVAVLFTIIWIFARMEGRPFLEFFGLDVPPAEDFTRLFKVLRPNAQIYTAAGVLVAAALVSQLVTRPPTLVPDRAELAAFPMRLGDFEGREALVEDIYLDVLKTSDHLMGRYTRPADPMPVDLWIAYYDSQVKGASVHSPQSCLPGGGWNIESFEQVEIPDVLADGGGLRVNRVEIGMGEERQLVYYWFAQRGRTVTNEFMVKWLIFWDGLRLNRTDGALVRLSTFVGDKSRMAEADDRLQAFLRAADPKLTYHLPGANATLREASVSELSRLEAQPQPAGAGT